MNEELKEEMDKVKEMAQILQLFDKFQEMENDNLEAFKESVYALLAYNRNINQ